MTAQWTAGGTPARRVGDRRRIRIRGDLIITATLLESDALIATGAMVETPPVDRNHSAVATACRVARIADEFRGQDVLVLDMRPVTPIFDFFVIVSAASQRQMHALAEEVNTVLKQHGQTRIGVEGLEGSSWVLEDFGDVVLHVFHPDTRRLYDLERLWADAPRVDWRAASRS